MKAFLINFLEDIKAINFGSLIGWGIAIYIVIVVFGFILSPGNPANIIVTTTILSLLYVIYTFSKEIDNLKGETKSKDEILKNLDWEDLLKAQKRMNGEKLNQNHDKK